MTFHIILQDLAFMKAGIIKPDAFLQRRPGRIQREPDMGQRLLYRRIFIPHICPDHYATVEHNLIIPPDIKSIPADLPNHLLQPLPDLVPLCIPQKKIKHIFRTAAIIFALPDICRKYLLNIAKQHIRRPGTKDLIDKLKLPDIQRRQAVVICTLDHRSHIVLKSHHVVCAGKRIVIDRTD